MKKWHYFDNEIVSDVAGNASSTPPRTPNGPFVTSNLDQAMAATLGNMASKPVGIPNISGK